MVNLYGEHILSNHKLGKLYIYLDNYDIQENMCNFIHDERAMFDVLNPKQIIYNMILDNF